MSSAFLFAVNIIAKKVVGNDKFSSRVEKAVCDAPALVSYMNDGVDGSFPSKLFKALAIVPQVQRNARTTNLLTTALGSIL